MMRAGLVSVAVLVVASIPIGEAHGSQAHRTPAAVSGELRQWHKVTLTLNGPQASETDSSPNPFTDYRMTVTFTHESGSPRYEVPGYFAADGDAANTSATSGNKWRAHVSPDKTGRWNWRASFVSGPGVAITPGGDRAGGGAGGRRHRIVRGHRVEQDRARFPRERPAAVRGQALPAIRGIR